MNEAERNFILKLADVSVKQEAFEKREKAKRAVVQTALRGLTDEKKESIRQKMTFQVVDSKGKKHEKSLDSRGQEYSVDTEESVGRGRGLTKEDYARAQEAMEEVMKIVSQVRDQKDESGQPLFSLQDIADEVFTPLVREGLLPENFVTDPYSETKKLLGASFSRYKETLDETREEKERQRAKTEVDFHGGGTKVDMLKGLGGKVGELKDGLVEKLGISETTMRRLQIAKEGAMLAKDVVSTGIETQRLASGRALEEAQAYLTKGEQGVVEYKQGLRLKAKEERDADTLDIFGGLASKLEKLIPDEVKRNQVLGKLVDGFEQGSKKLDQALDKILDSTLDLKDKALDFLDKDETSYVLDSLSLAGEAIGDGVGIGMSSKELDDTRKALEGAKYTHVARKEVARAVDGIDAALVKAVAKLAPQAGEAIEGLYRRKVDLREAQDQAGNYDETNGPAVVAALAAGFPAAFTAATDDPVFAKAGQQVAKAFRAKVDGTKLTDALKKDPKTAFKSVVESAAQAAAKELGTLDGQERPEDDQTAKDLKKRLSDPDVCKDIARRTAIGDETAMLEDLAQSDEEIKEYERQLVLIDEGGLSSSEQRSIEKLIDELKRDKQVLDMIASLGATISGVGSTVTTIVGRAQDLTGAVMGEVMGPLKAAKLIVQLGVNVIKAAKRWQLWNKFRVDLDRARKAGSPLSSTIQGFYENKKEQCAFHTIEDALMTVQIAGAILGSIPEPMTLAVGKTVSAIADTAQQANKVAGMIYNEVQLTRAWTTTKAALNKPGNRALGLKALRLNPTLAMHAIAWAGLEKRDPIARMVLDSVGLNEQTLEDGATEKKVRQYLETLLDEDRKLLDSKEIKTDWMPPNPALTAKDWYVVAARAARDATPKLRPGDDKAVLAALKRTDAHDLKKLGTSADTGAIADDEMKRLDGEAQALCDALNAYDPKTPDGSEHEEMAGVVATFLRLAAQHRADLRKLADRNATERAARDPKVAIGLLSAQLAAVEKCQPTDELPQLRRVLVNAQDAISSVQRNTHLRDDRVVRSHLEQLQEKIQPLNNLIEQLQAQQV